MIQIGKYDECYEEQPSRWQRLMAWKTDLYYRVLDWRHKRRMRLDPEYRKNYEATFVGQLEKALRAGYVPLAQESHALKVESLSGVMSLVTFSSENIAIPPKRSLKQSWWKRLWA